MQATPTTETLPPCCVATFAHVRRVRRDVLCDCGDVCVYTPPAPPARTVLSLPPAALAAPVPAPIADCDDLAHHRVTIPGPPPDRRVQVVRDPRPEDTGRYRALTAPVDDPVERTARLLEELHTDLRPRRVDAGGDPLGFGGSAGVDWGRDVVQTSPRWGSVDLVSPVDPTASVDDTIAARTAPGSPERATLEWLRRRCGVTAERLREGGEEVLRGLHLGCGYELAEPEVRARLDTVPETLRLGAPIAGRRRIEAAMRAWWGT